MALASIELSNVSVKFDQLTVLDGISLSIPRGERLVLVGPSGQGKTVLLKLMAGLIEPSLGQVRIQGEDLATLSVARRQELTCKMGMLFQKNALFDSLSCAQNIAFPLREVTRLSETEIEQTVDKFLEAVGIAHAKHLYPVEISGGMQKRLGIARALALDPEIIFYDDPTAGLDPITSRKIIELILELQVKKRSTLVAVTNDMNRAYQLADRIAMVVDRQLIITGNVEQTRKHVDPRVNQFINGYTQGPLTVMA